VKNTVSRGFKGSEGESYLFTYDENSDLVVKRLLHGKLESFNPGGCHQNEPSTHRNGGESPGTLTYAKSLHAENRGFEGSLTETSRWYFDEIKDADLPWVFRGQGIEYRTCSTFMIKGCLEHQPAYLKKIKHNCGRASCPVCYKSWLVKTTEKMVDRIEGGKPRTHRKPVHVTISPPQADWYRFEDINEFRKLRRKANKISKQAGLKGGCNVPHPYREDRKTGLWRESPHFHVIGYGWIRNTKQIYQDTGWIVQNHRIRKTVGGTAYYQLSHAGIREGIHAVSWFGTLSWRNLKRDPIRAEPETCPICGNILRHVIYLGTGDNPFSDPEIEILLMSTLQWEYG